MLLSVGQCSIGKRTGGNNNGVSPKATLIAKQKLETGEFWKLFQAIKAHSAKRFSTAKSVANLTEEPPVIQQDEDLSGEDIPFNENR